MGGAPITVCCYRDGIESYGRWIVDPVALTRVRALAAEGGVSCVEDVIWHNLEPWTKAVTDAWPAVDSFRVVLHLDSDVAPASAPPAPKRKAKRKR